MRLLLVIFCLMPYGIAAQNTISGKVVDHKGEAVAFANVYLKAIFDGGSTDAEGYFEFTTTASGISTLVVSSIGYETVSLPIDIEASVAVQDIQLRPAGNELVEVVVSAGAFEASDEKKGTILKPLDIVTNPAASADLYGALQTLPGVAPVNEETGIFVRGGQASETKTIIDGALVAEPFFGDVPDIPARGRFNPFLFKGTLFSTGGYSAEYGQAMSSVLILNTQDMPNKEGYGFSLNMAGISGDLTKTWKDKTAFLANIGYSNLNPLFSIVPQNRSWIKPPNGINGALGFRHKTGEQGLFKSYLQYQQGHIALDIAPDTSTERPFQNRNKNLFWNNSYRGLIGENWGVLVVASLSYDDDQDQLESNSFGSREWLGQSRITLNREVGSFFIRFGNETQWSDGFYYFNEYESRLNNNFTAFYAETDVKLSKKIGARIGLRGEYASVINSSNLTPRLSLTYKTGAKSLISLAYGQFYQTPESDFLRQSTDVGFEHATHYIINYQWQTEQRIFRIEAYYKDYHDLILNDELTTFNNDGFGSAKGVDIFWRDQQTIPKLTYWFSYSLIDAQRYYQDFPSLATPTFVATHTFNVIGQYRFTKQSRLGISYTYASGRPYFNPNNLVFLADRLKDYHNINLSASYLTTISGNFTVIYASLKNPFMFKQIFGYRYADDGITRTAIEPASDWSFFAGISISFRKS